MYYDNIILSRNFFSFPKVELFEGRDIFATIIIYHHHHHHRDIIIIDDRVRKDSEDIFSAEIINNFARFSIRFPKSVETSYGRFVYKTSIEVVFLRIFIQC